MAKQNEPSLNDMPSEIRNKILTMAVFHTESDGIISPAPKKTADEFVVLVSNERYTVIDDGSPFIPYAENEEQADRIADTRQIWVTSANFKSNHFCSLDCLKQPAITQVNSQYRRQSLPIFYGVNHFHLELRNFKLPKGDEDWSTEVALVDWWRTIGNVNFGKIRHLSFVGQKDYLRRRREDGLVVTYKDEPRSVTMKRTCTHPWDGITMPCDKDNAQHEEVDIGVKPQLAALEEEGLNIKALEKIVAWLEPPWAHFLRTENLEE